MRPNPVAFDTFISPHAPRRPTHGDAYGRGPTSPTRRRRRIGSSARADAAAIIAGRRDREGKVDRPNAARVRASPERTRANVRTSARGKTRARGRFIHSFIHSIIHSRAWGIHSCDRSVRAVKANERKN